MKKRREEEEAAQKKILEEMKTVKLNEEEAENAAHAAALKKAEEEIRDCIKKLNEYSRTGLVQWKCDNRYTSTNLFLSSITREAYEALVKPERDAFTVHVIDEYKYDSIKRIKDKLVIADKDKDYQRIIELEAELNAEEAAIEYADSSSERYPQHPSLAWLVENNRFNRTAWQIISYDQRRNAMFKDYCIFNWYQVLEKDEELINELIEAVKKAEETYRKQYKYLKKQRKIKIIATCFPVSILFFFLIFILRNIGIVWGTIILGALIGVLMAIFADEVSTEKIKGFFLYPIMGGVTGLVIGGIGYVISLLSWSFVTVLWAIVVIGANLIVIFSDDL